MSTELATTQPVRRPGTPAPNGQQLPADKLGLTLRERMWLARAGLGTMILSIVASAALFSMMPKEPATPVDPLRNELADRESLPIAPTRAEPPVVLPPAEIQRPAQHRPEPEPTEEPALEPLAPPPLATPELIKPDRRPVGVRPIQIIRNTRLSTPSKGPLDLSQPQPLGTTPTAKQVEKTPAAPPVADKDENELKRPSFE